MKKKNILRVFITVAVFVILICSAFINTDQVATGENVTTVGDYPQYVQPQQTEAEATEVSGLEKVVGDLNGIAWGVFMCALLVGTGVYLTIRGKAFQFAKFGHMWRNTFGKIFNKEEKKRRAGKGEVTPFQAMTTAMAGTVGTGNIAGVTGAIVLGGPGAVFWMWVAALFGMFTKFAEVVLAVKFREKNQKGEWVGGPMYYIRNGLGKNWNWLAILFSVFGALAAFGIGSMTQVNTIASTIVTAVDSVTAAPIGGSVTETTLRIIVGVVIAAITGMVIIGGVKRVGKVTEKLVPFMSLFYVLGALIVIIVNIGSIGMVFGSIFQGAFATESVVGGVGGFLIMNAIKRGVGRGVFSNEAGLGSAPIAHAGTSETNPVKQGLYGIFEVFMDTIVICTITSLVVLMSGVVPWGNASLAGAETTVMAFSSVFGTPVASFFIAVAILFFALSTILSWALYGSRCFGFLTGERGVVIYQLLFIASVIIGAIMKLDLVWNIADTMNGFMAVPNLIAILALSGVVIAEVKKYRQELKLHPIK